MGEGTYVPGRASHESSVATGLRCRCGKVRGEVNAARAYTRGTCYCKDCQAYARFLGQPGLMNDRGGTDIVPMSPSGVRIDEGLEQVACVSLSEDGRLRWYAACCRTPLGNTPRDPKLSYVGMPTTCFAAAPETIDAAFGARDRIVLNTGSASGIVRGTPLAFFLGGLRILGNMLAARVRREPPTLFFDASGRPIRRPRVLSAAERAALGANPR